MAEAAKQAGVQHVIWSTLEDTRRFIPLDDDRMPTLQGKYKVPHFDGKGEANAQFSEGRRADHVPADLILLGELHLLRRRAEAGRGRQARAGDARWATRSCRASRSTTSARASSASSNAGAEFIGETVGIAGEHLSGAELAAAMTRVVGETVSYQDVPPEIYRGFDFPGADDMANMFQFKRDFNDYYRGARSVEFTRSLNPELQTFDQWLTRHASRIPIEAVAG